MKSTLDLRFAVADDRTGQRSAPWFAVSRKAGDVYLSSRAAGRFLKISLHGHSRICRYAETQEIAGGPRPAIIRWIRLDTPPKGSGTGSHAVRMFFPTSYLGRSADPLPASIRRIEPAPSGMATVVDVLFTREDQRTVVQHLVNGQDLVSYTPLPDGEACVILGGRCEWRNRDIIVPPSYAESRELRFTAALPPSVERSFSLFLPVAPQCEGDPLTVTELYGYAVAPETPPVPLTEGHLVLSRSVAPSVWRPHASTVTGDNPPAAAAQSRSS